MIQSNEGEWLIERYFNELAEDEPVVVNGTDMTGFPPRRGADQEYGDTYSVRSPLSRVADLSCFAERADGGGRPVPESENHRTCASHLESLHHTLQAGADRLGPGRSMLAIVPELAHDALSRILSGSNLRLKAAAHLTLREQRGLGALFSHPVDQANSTDLIITDLGPDDVGRVERLARQVMFLPKTTWRMTHIEMILDGVSRGVWHGSGVIDPKTGSVLSYLDHRIMPDGRVRIGFCMTAPHARGRGHMQRLIAHLILRYFDRLIDVSSHEQNASMLAVLKRFGFAQVRRIERERVNGEATLYLERMACNPVIL